MGVVIDEVVGEVEPESDSNAPDIVDTGDQTEVANINEYVLMTQLAHIKQRKLRIEAD